MGMIVVAPHPDDMEISCGLLVWVALRFGIPVVEIVLTDGCHGGTNREEYGTIGLARRRAWEAEESARILGVSDVLLLGIENGKLNLSLSAAAKSVAAVLERAGANIVVAPSRLDEHQDHIATAEVVQRALSVYGRPIILIEYAFWAHLECNVILKAPLAWDTKYRAIQVHRSQPVRKYLSMLNCRGSLHEERFLLRQHVGSAVTLFATYLMRVGSEMY